MRKVYHSERSSAGWWISLLGSAVLTMLLFASLPFAHRIANPERSLELRRVSAAELPPPAQELEITPPPPAEQPRPEAPPQPQLADVPPQMPLSADLEVALGSGGALAGLGDVRALTAVEPVSEDAFDVAELERRPEAVSQVPPAYPAELRKARIEGTVVVVFVLNEEGRVEDPRVESSSRPEFEKPALDAIRKWRFRPGWKDGQPVRTFVRQAIRFRASAG
jgi:protein TonB